MKKLELWPIRTQMLTISIKLQWKCWRKINLWGVQLLSSCNGWHQESKLEMNSNVSYDDLIRDLWPGIPATFYFPIIPGQINVAIILWSRCFWVLLYYDIAIVLSHGILSLKVLKVSPCQTMRREVKWDVTTWVFYIKIQFPWKFNSLQSIVEFCIVVCLACKGWGLEKQAERRLI